MDWLVLVIVDPKLFAIALVVLSLAIKPAGIETMIDKEMLKAMITSKDLTLRLERFLVARLIIPIYYTNLL